jgi:hypothetical protein
MWKELTDLIDKNWQGIVIILAIVAIFVWYQALGLGSSQSVQDAVDGVASGIKQTASNLNPTTSDTDEGEGSMTEGEMEKETAQNGSTAGFSQQVATPGQGVTHLARQALDGYLTTIKPQVNLTTEHKIYIEDYLKDQTSSMDLEIGQQLSFSQDLIDQGIALSQQLSEAQLSNLTMYTHLVPDLEGYAPPAL